MAILKDEILLESGTNEIQILRFTIGGVLYGINVAKVRQITISEPVKFMPHTHEAVEGIFKPRDVLITVVDLPYYVTDEHLEKSEKDLFIITNFNNLHVAFRVHTVVGISRLSWKDISKPDKTVAGGDEGIATGIAQCGGELVTILDFEKIVAEIAPETSIQISEIEKLGPRSRNSSPIVAWLILRLLGCLFQIDQIRFSTRFWIGKIPATLKCIYPNYYLTYTNLAIFAL